MIKYMHSALTVAAIYSCLIRQPFSAFAAPCPFYIPKLWAAFLTDQVIRRRNRFITDRTSSRINQIYDSVCIVSIISHILSFNPVNLFCSFAFSIICMTCLLLPSIVTQFLALVTPVYSRFLLKSILGPVSSGIITAGDSLPCDLCLVIA